MKSIFLRPWKIVIGYMLITLILFLFGPWIYKSENRIGLILYLTLFAFCSSLAYRKGVSKALKYSMYTTDPKDDNLDYLYESGVISPRKLNLLVFVFAIVSTVIFGLGFMKNGVPTGGSIVANMASAYSTVQSTASSGRDVPLWIFENFSFIIYFAMILGFAYYKKLPHLAKSLLIYATVILSLYFMLYRGQQKQFGDIVIIIASALLLNISWGNIKIEISKKFWLIVLIITVVLFFSSVLSGRLIMMNKNMYTLSQGVTSQLNPNSLLFKILPEEISLGFAFFIYYISHGYQGLALCLQQPFVWTRFLGSCSAVTTLLERYLSIDTSIILQTYPMRTELATGWSATATWHTIFPWLASDFTFAGAIVILSIGAYMYGICWVECIIEKKWQSIILFTVFNIQWFYMVANNQLFTLKSTLMVVIFAVFFWAIRRIKFKFGNITL